MICPRCGSDNTACRESRQLKLVRRRRYFCMNCQKGFTTHEIPVHRIYKKDNPMVYVSDDGMWVSSNIAPDVREVDDTKES